MPTQPAILGTMRLGNFRLGYESAALAALRRTRVTVMIAGVLANARVRVGSLSIRDILNDAPNTAAFVMDGTAPVDGQDVRITINSDAPRLLFNGTLQATDLTYEGRATQTAFPCAAIDDIARLNQRRPFGTWTNISVTTIAQYLIATFAPGFTSTHVAASLPTVSITFDGTDEFSACLGRLATAIGGYFYVEDLDLHLFQTEATDPPDTLDTTPGRFEDDPPIRVSTDRSNMRTRQTGKGHGEAIPVDLPAGSGVIPVADAVMFNAGGGQAIASTTADGATSEILTYTGTTLGGSGSLVGPSVSPSVAPGLTLAAGAGLGTGVYQTAYTFATAAGETLPSPLATVTTTNAYAVPGPLTAGAPTAGTPYVDVGNHDYVVTFVTAIGETLSGTASNSITTTSTNQVVPLSGIPIGPAGVTQRKIYRRFNGAGTYKLTKTINDNTQTSTGDGTTNAALGTAAPGADTTAGHQIALSGIAIGPSGTTSRKIYRTVVDGSQLKLQQTIANNTSTVGVQDATADGSLGADAPISNTSGLAAGASIGGGFVTVTPVVFATNGAATVANTSAPIFTSATYTFVAADVGAYLYIKSGTNWTVGRYPIVSVAGGAATLSGACASVASPTTGTWGVDYSGFTTPRVTFTDLVIDPTTATKFTSAAFPVGPNYIGNTLSVSNAVGFSEQRVTVISVSGTTATCDKQLGTLSSTGGSGFLGLGPVIPYVFAGSSTLVLASTAPFSGAGGWVTIGEQLVRYTGISGNVLTGIPALGTVGALVSTVAFNEHVSVHPALTGVTGLTKALAKGSPVHIWVQRNDLAAQAALIALDAAQGRVSDGVVEGPPIVDARDGEALMTARCDAMLARYSRPIVTVTYATRDVKTKSGKPIVINLTNPPISQTLTIQEVTITDIDVAPNSDAMASRCAPKFMVTASSVRFSLEDLLRRLAE